MAFCKHHAIEIKILKSGQEEEDMKKNLDERTAAIAISLCERAAAYAKAKKYEQFIDCVELINELLTDEKGKQNGL